MSERFGDNWTAEQWREQASRNLDCAYEERKLRLATDELIQQAVEALEPFVNVRDQFPQSIKLITPKLDGLTPVTLTVTKDQFRSAVTAFTALTASQNEGGRHGER